MKLNFEILKQTLIDSGTAVNLTPEQWQIIAARGILQPFINAIELSQKEILAELKGKNILTAKQVTDTIKLIK